MTDDKTDRLTSHGIRRLLKEWGYVTSHDRKRQAIRVPNQPVWRDVVIITVDYDSAIEGHRTADELCQRLQAAGLDARLTGNGSSLSLRKGSGL